MQNIKQALAELLGTFFFVLLGAGSIVISSHMGASGAGLIGIAIAHGLALSIAISATMNVSGGHINPAVTVGLIVIGKETVPAGALKIAGQLIGATIAGFLLKGLLPAEAVLASGLGTPAPGAGLSLGTVFFLEVIATFLLAFAIYGTAAAKRAPVGLGGFGIGLTLAAVIFTFGPLTGAALNPARWFGPALASGQLSTLWVYFLGPIVGATLGLLVSRCALEECCGGKGCCCAKNEGTPSA